MIGFDVTCNGKAVFSVTVPCLNFKFVTPLRKGSEAIVWNMSKMCPHWKQIWTVPECFTIPNKRVKLGEYSLLDYSHCVYTDIFTQLAYSLYWLKYISIHFFYYWMNCLIYLNRRFGFHVDQLLSIGCHFVPEIWETKQYYFYIFSLVMRGMWICSIQINWNMNHEI